MTARLSDVIEPEVFADYQAENSPEKSALINSGIIATSELLDQKANTGGTEIQVPFWKDLDASSEPNISTDNPATNSTPGKITAGNQKASIAYLNKDYSAADLAGEIAGSNPMERISDRLNTYWDRQLQRRLLASASGILAGNIASNNGDMVHNIAIEAGNTATAANLYSRSAFVEAAFTMGDQFDAIQTIGVHSVVLKRMVENNDIDYIPDSQGNLTVPTFMGKRVIVDDTMTAVAGATNGVKYTSILFGNGAFGMGEGTPEVPFEIQRNPSGGNGGGIETLHDRKTWLLHPFGYSFDASAGVASTSATLAELAAAPRWSRVVERKNVPLAFLITNG